jgi:hypothetical protein
MTETTERRGNGGDVETGENQQQVFTCFHIPLGIRQTPPDSHIPTAPATVALPKTQKTKTRKESAAARPPLPDLFQNHVVLETLLHFRIIRRLEYAWRDRLDINVDASAEGMVTTNVVSTVSDQGLRHNDNTGSW